MNPHFLQPPLQSLIPPCARLAGARRHVQVHRSEAHQKSGRLEEVYRSLPVHDLQKFGYQFSSMPAAHVASEVILPTRR